MPAPTLFITELMRQFLPDAESVTEYFGAYEVRGCSLEIVPMPDMGGYGLRMSFGPDSNACPIFPLPDAEMQTEEDARRWMAHVRDNLMRPFAYMLDSRQPRAIN